MELKNSNHTKYGFTLLETLVAISILITAIVGPLTLAAQTIRSQQVAKYNLIAANLAQEGAEFIRNYRSNNILYWRIAKRDAMLAGNPNPPDPLEHWIDGMDECFNSGCGIDAWYVDAPSLPSCPGGVCELFYDQSSNLYTHINCAGCETTPFRRAVLIKTVPEGTPIATADEVRVRVTVSWSGILGARSLTATTHLLNWDSAM